jgi:hypothetical protein
MPSALWTRIVIGLAAALWGGMAWALNAPLNAVWLKPAGAVSSIVVFALVAFDVFAWRWLPLFITKRPNVRGTWAAQLEYTWPCGTPPKTKPCYLVIRQTFSTVSVRMYFDISSSRSLSADVRLNDGQYSLGWAYSSEAHQLDRENPAHRGAAELVIATVPRRSLRGTYWTERKTTGRITTTGWSKHLFDTFEAAKGGEYRAR